MKESINIERAVEAYQFGPVRLPRYVADEVNQVAEELEVLPEVVISEALLLWFTVYRAGWRAIEPAQPRSG